MTNTSAPKFNVLKLLTCTAGIYFFYLTYAVLHEKILNGTYGAEAERFNFTFTYLFLQCFINAVFALVLLLARRQSIKSPAKITSFLQIACSYFGATFCSNYALQFINYPTQVLAKSCKMIPVMFMGVLILGKRYTIKHYIRVFLITFGIFLFMMKKVDVYQWIDGFLQSFSSDSTVAVGLGLAGISLTLDGITSTLEEKVLSQSQPAHQPEIVGSRSNSKNTVAPDSKDNSKKSSAHTHPDTTLVMFWVNFCSLFYLIPAVIITGEAMPAAEFFMRHPTVIAEVSLTCIASGFGQMFIFSCIGNFGALMTSLVTTTRKFITILASVLVYRHPITQTQWIGVAFVFFALLWDTYERIYPSAGAHAANPKKKKE